MSLIRPTLLFMIALLSGGSALAQRPGPEFRRPLALVGKGDGFEVFAVRWPASHSNREQNSKRLIGGTKVSWSKAFLRLLL